MTNNSPANPVIQYSNPVGAPKSNVQTQANGPIENDIFNMNNQRLVITKMSTTAAEYPLQKTKEFIVWLQVLLFYYCHLELSNIDECYRLYF